jgi:PIN domain nuclease of toxin-antitoxin system
VAQTLAAKSHRHSKEVRLLLDTHALLWFLERDKRLSASARRAIESRRNSIWASAVSGYELGLKCAYGKLNFPIHDLEPMLSAANIDLLPVLMSHAVKATDLQQNHGDPWDRILVAQASIEDLILVTRDERLRDYGIRTFW